MTRKTTRPTDKLTSAVMTRELPKLTLAEQVDLFEKTIRDLEIAHESAAIAIGELGRVMSSAKQTIVDLRHVIANLKNVGE